MAAPARHRSRPGTILRALLATTAALLVVALVVIAPLVGYALLSPFTGVPVPIACEGRTAGPASRLSRA